MSGFGASLGSAAAAGLPLLRLALLLLGGAAPASGAVLRARPPPPAGAGNGQACAALSNKGTHSTVDVQVGTPSQMFSVVADTGSNTLIVASCACQEAGYCDESDRCYVGTNRSSSYSLTRGSHGPQQLVISFGSGIVRGVVARERVYVGSVGANMTDGLLLMTGKALNFPGPFEGILGLGVPKARKEHVNATEPPSSTGNSSAAAGEGGAWEAFRQALEKIMGIIRGHGEASATESGQAGAGGLAVHSEAVKPDTSALPAVASNGTLPEQPEYPPGFLEQAGISRFSMCFNDGADGVLRIGVPPLRRALGNIGTEHWGLGFQGIGIGDARTPLGICSPANMSEGQETPCGAIPDSGTTMITGPSEHVALLLEELCESWPRCRQNHTALQVAADAASEAAKAVYGIDPFGIRGASKTKVLELLLLDCERWLDEGAGLEELPPLHFTVTGSDGTAQTLTLAGGAYVIQDFVEDSASLFEELAGSGSANFTRHMNHTTSHRQKVCMPAFSVLDYNTEKNGPVWILGTSFFYEFDVGFDLSSEPPSVSFTSVAEQPCGSCDKEVGLVTTDVGPASPRPRDAAAARRRPRWGGGRPRRPNIDTSRPL